MDHTDSKKNELKAEKAFKVSETFKLVEPPKEAKVSKMDVSPKVVDPCLLAKTTMDGAAVEAGRRRRSLLKLPQAAVKSVSMLMASALQSGWQMCSWKVSTMSPLSPAAPPSPPRSPLLIHAGGNVKWCGHTGKTVWSLLIRLNMQLSYGLVTVLLGIYPR